MTLARHCQRFKHVVIGQQQPRRDEKARAVTLPATCKARLDPAHATCSLEGPFKESDGQKIAGLADDALHQMIINFVWGKSLATHQGTQSSGQGLRITGHRSLDVAETTVHPLRQTLFALRLVVPFVLHRARLPLTLPSRCRQCSAASSSHRSRKRIHLVESHLMILP